MKRKHIKTSIAAIPNAGMAAVAGMIADPSDFPVIRKSGIYSTMPTAVAKPYRRDTMNWDPSVANDVELGLSPDQWGGFIFRNPFRASVLYERKTPAVNVRYNWVFNPVSGEVDELGVSTLEQYVSVGEQVDLFPVWANADASNTWNPHGDKIYAGEDDGHRYIYVDGDGTGTSITFTLTMSTATTSAASRKAYLYRYDGGVRRLVTTWDSGAIGTLTMSTTLPVSDSLSGYYMISVVNNDTAAMAVQVRSISNALKASWAHRTVSQLTSNLNSLNEVRVLAANILVQNTASSLNKQGKSVICQAVANEDWLSFYGQGQTMYTNISLNPSSRSFKWEDGLYGFLKPTGEKDLDYISPFVTTGTSSQIEDACFPLKQGDYLAFCISTTDSEGGDAQYVIQHAMEYRTRNQWLEIAPPSISPEEFEMGIQAVISMEQFYHNPIHWKKIFSTIGKIARVGAPIISRFGPLGAGAGAVMGTIGEALQ